MPTNIILFFVWYTHVLTPANPYPRPQVRVFAGVQIFNPYPNPSKTHAFTRGFHLPVTFPRRLLIVPFTDRDPRSRALGLTFQGGCKAFMDYAASPFSHARLLDQLTNKSSHNLQCSRHPVLSFPWSIMHQPSSVPTLGVLEINS